MIAESSIHTYLNQMKIKDTTSNSIAPVRVENKEICNIHRLLQTGLLGAQFSGLLSTLGVGSGPVHRNLRRGAHLPGPRVTRHLSLGVPH